MKSAFARLIRGRFWALALKELRQIRRDRRLVISLIVPPTLQILLFGFALTSDIQNLRLGAVDESRTAESRELAARPREPTLAMSPLARGRRPWLREHRRLLAFARLAHL
jgi:hypothetical protein